ncbi:MAG: phosphoribosyltransferase domain-containing protein [Clostridium sp.]|nr:phosphoribosyltransferase domain-containing protein [Clostridium sp.]
MNYLDFSCDINIKDNPLNLNIDDYLDLALRNNKKRRFLFISKNLGKHIPVNPEKVDNLGYLLAKAYKKKYLNYKEEEELVIGFAETATALSHSFFNYLESAKLFIHTTRENLDLNRIDFLEEHSHATEQILYTDKIFSLKNIDTLILVDDEITTAKTCINMIKELQKNYKAKKYVIASILNWIDEKREEEIKAIAKGLNCKIEFVYLFNGSFNFKFHEDKPLIDKIEEVNSNKEVKVKFLDLNLERHLENKKYLKGTGRFGIDRKEQEELINILKASSEKLNSIRENDKILALGVEEFMYIPMILSKFMKGDIYYHSITRSPIIPFNDKNYPIKKKYKLNSFYNNNINYLYNLNINNSKECFLFLETFVNEKRIEDIINLLSFVNIEKINIIKC